jgi:hypothetical protein
MVRDNDENARLLRICIYGKELSICEGTAQMITVVAFILAPLGIWYIPCILGRDCKLRGCVAKSGLIRPIPHPKPGSYYSSGNVMIRKNRSHVEF